MGSGCEEGSLRFGIAIEGSKLMGITNKRGKSGEIHGLQPAQVEDGICQDGDTAGGADVGKEAKLSSGPDH